MKVLNKSLFSLSFLTLVAASSFTNISNASEQSLGAQISGLGVGVQYTHTLDWSFLDSDQIQFKVAASGLSGDDIEEFETSGDYDTNIDIVSFNTGLNWYPFSGRFARNIYFSTGLLYLDAKLDGTSESNQNFRVGQTNILSSDDFSLTIESEQKLLTPYFGIGWGNRLSERTGFYFQAELTVIPNLDKSDYTLRARDPNQLLQPDDLALERRELENDEADLAANFTLSLGYQF